MLTAFPDPTPQVRGITKQLVTTKRADGTQISFTLYLPPGYQKGTRLPTILFRAGVARSGAYNHTLRPFGFQTEHRTFYQARDTYLKLSPLINADKINEPLLLIHGQLDANPGTVPLQSEKLFEALRGAGGTTRLIMLPYESHGYVAIESIETVMAESIDWFARYVKNAPPRSKLTAQPPPPGSRASN